MLIDELLKQNHSPDSIAVVYEQQHITYRQLWKKVDVLANAILNFASNEQFIGISATKSIEMIIGLLAILKAGKAYLPLDANYPQARLKQLIDDADLKYIVCHNAESPFFKDLTLIPIASDKAYNLPHQEVTNRSDIVCVLYTSGSTGTPKGVCLGHEGLINQLKWQKAHGVAKPGARTLQFSHLSFDGAFLEIFVPLYTGGTIYLITESYRTNIGKLLHFINDNRINRLFLAYVVVQYLAETAQQYNLYPVSLQEIITGGELLRITPQIANLFHKLDSCVLMNVYGPTESSVWVTELKMQGDALNWPSIPSIGKSIGGVSLFLADANLNLVTDTTAGEILIYGDCNALYYLNKPEQTAERFIEWHHPELGELRVYRTGDLATYNDDGTLQFQGRQDEQVKVKGGYRVELAEIEIIITKIKGVSQVKVITREDIPGQKRIIAYLILSDITANENDIKNEVDSQLPLYMVPDAYVVLKEFPYTVSGKVDRAALPAPEKVLLADTQIHMQPVNEMEIYLTSLWENVLQVRNVGTNDDFFDVGGSSLVAIEMLTRIERDKGIQLPIVSVYEHNTIQKLATLVQANDVLHQATPLVALKATGTRPPVYLIHGDNLNVVLFSGIARYINEDQPVYGLQPRGLDGKSAPLESIEAIARYYLDAIILQNPKGPYAIVGYSFGGYVAFEMVKQLKKMGRKVLMLGLIDVDAKLAINDLSLAEALSTKVVRQFPKLLWLAKSIATNPVETMGYQMANISERVKNMLNIKPTYKGPSKAFYELRDSINEVHHQALANYNLEQYDGRIVLFKAMERPYFVDDFECLGWRPYATHTIEVHSIPGNHASMFEEPNSKVLAKELGNALTGGKGDIDC